MIPFWKHAPESTRRPNSLLFRFARRASLVVPVVVAPIIFLLAAPPWADAAPTTRQHAHAKSHTEAPKAAAQREDGKETHGRSEQPATDAKIPIRVTRVETPDGPSVLATIGDFPSDLNEAGQEFLKLEFFEHFASDVLGVGDSDSPRTTLKVALLPQEKENQREADFRLGKVSGHMVVLVEKRRVLVACTFSETEQTPRLLAFVGRLAVGTVAAE
jgi:hypothetical protein